MLGKIEGKRRGRQRTRWLDGVTDAMDRNFSEPRKTVKDRESWRAAAHGVTESRVRLGDGTTTIVLSQRMAQVQYTVLFLSGYFSPLELFHPRK